MKLGDVVRIERYHTTAVWEKGADGTWSLGCEDTGTHFHLFDRAGRKIRIWGRELSLELKHVVYPGDQVTADAEPREVR